MSYPVVLQIEGKLATVVGGGAIALRKVKSLLRAGAIVTVVAPKVHEQLLVMHRNGQINLHMRKFEKTDITDSFIVIAATDQQDINLAVYESAKGKLINIVDRPDLCSFHVPAVFEQGHLKMAISTDGISPALAKKIKFQLAKIYDEHFSDYLLFLKKARAKIFAKIKDNNDRKTIFEQLVSDSFYESDDWDKSLQQMIDTFVKKDRRF